MKRGIAMIGLGAAFCSGLYDGYFHDVPERVYGLEEMVPADAVLQSVSIPSVRDSSEVVLVQALPNEQYKVTEKQGRTVVDGLFGYCIKSSDGFAVRPDPETMRYDPASKLCDQRQGTLVYSLPSTVIAQK